MKKMIYYKDISTWRDQQFEFAFDFSPNIRCTCHITWYVESAEMHNGPEQIPISSETRKRKILHPSKKSYTVISNDFRKKNALADVFLVHVEMKTVINQFGLNTMMVNYVSRLLNRLPPNIPFGWVDLSGLLPRPSSVMVFFYYYYYYFEELHRNHLLLLSNSLFRLLTNV